MSLGQEEDDFAMLHWNWEKPLQENNTEQMIWRETIEWFGLEGTLNIT